jgi:hypothetical protein
VAGTTYTLWDKKEDPAVAKGLSSLIKPLFVKMIDKYFFDISVQVRRVTK